ncbi:hypothetical protein Bca101_058515 [Brassica carinata]
MMDDKRESLRNKDNRFAEKVSEFKDSLRSRFQTFQESLILDQQQQPKETTSVVSTDLSSNHPSTTTRSLMSIMKVQTFGIICCYLLYLSLTKTLVARFDLKNIGFGGDVNGSVGLDKSCRVGVRNCAFCGGWRFKRETGSLERRQGGKI